MANGGVYVLHCDGYHAFRHPYSGVVVEFETAPMRGRELRESGRDQADVAPACVHPLRESPNQLRPVRRTGIERFEQCLVLFEALHAGSDAPFCDVLA